MTDTHQLPLPDRKTAAASAWLITDVEAMTLVSMLKGWLFIEVTSLFFCSA